MILWRIRALLVEALERHQFIRLEYVLPEEATIAEVREVMKEAGMDPVGDKAWTPGAGTYWWLCRMMGKG